LINVISITSAKEMWDTIDIPHKGSESSSDSFDIEPDHMCLMADNSASEVTDEDTCIS